MIIDYKSSVYTPAGWRSVIIRARAEQISLAMARVIEVIEIDGETPTRTMSRTGAKRQEYWGTGTAAREVGARKRLSTCTVAQDIQ